MKMKRIFLGSTLLLLIIVTACNKSQDSVTPTNNQKVLGMVLQTASQTNSSNLILLKDGRTINPVSGFNSTSIKPGNKFLLSFQTLSSTNSKIINVNVTSLSAASDSTFIPPPSGGTDSVTVTSLLQGTHSCTFTYSQVDSLSPNDTTKIIDKYIQIKVEGNTFASLNPPALPFFIPGGEGFFFFTPQNKNLINFINYRVFPSAAPTGFILTGQWHLFVFDSYVLIWKYGGFITPQNKHIQEFSSFKINK